MTQAANDNPGTGQLKSDAPNDSFHPRQVDCLAAAVQFLTRIPVPTLPQLSAEQYAGTLRGAVVYLPLVGGCIGIFSSTVFLGLSWGLSLWIAALVSLGCEALLTGAFHEDAFADTFDALGGGWTREQVLEIMKDSRLGTYGTMALVIGVGIRAACFVQLATQSMTWAIATIIAAAAFGRLAIVGIMATTAPIADRQSQARDVSGTQDWRTFAVGLVLTMPLWVGWIWLGPAQASVTLLAAIVLLIAYRRHILRRVGGTTGDLLGCSAYLTQLTILVGSSWCP